VKPVETQRGMTELNVRLGMAIALREWFGDAGPPQQLVATPPPAPPRGIAYGPVAAYAAACLRHLEWQSTWVSLMLAAGRARVVAA
jgi:hypothetical protein